MRAAAPLLGFPHWLCVLYGAPQPTTTPGFATFSTVWQPRRGEQAELASVLVLKQRVLLGTRAGGVMALALPEYALLRTAFASPHGATPSSSQCADPRRCLSVCVCVPSRGLS